jgi:serine/threonine-protein kinase HipA
VRGWREFFLSGGVSPKDVEYIAPAFLPDCFFFEQPVATV